MNRDRVIFGLILVLLGFLLLGRSFDLFYFTFGGLIRFLLPFAFIMLGIWLIIRKKRQEDRLQAHMMFTVSQGDTVSSGTDAKYQKSTRPEDTFPQQPTIEVSGDAAKVRYSKLLGDMFIDCANVNLQSVEISMGVGDVEVKLHGGKLGQGLNRMIISGFVSDIRIFTPADMPFYIHSSNFIGDIDIGGKRSGGFSNTVEHQSENYDTAKSKLYIAANNFIGDIKLFVV
ncbi:MAG: cell wall-active antibiotics response protein LiaF [Candidatus Zixiibacteriota bacterium]